MASQSFDAIIIGGGFYGCHLALALAKSGEKVLLLEREKTLLTRASLVNQARVHQGYHYPRSILTSIRSRANYERFRTDYPSAIYEQFDHYYAIARQNSKVTAAQFTQFCTRIGAPIEPAPDEVRKLFDESRIEGVFLVRECAFNAVALRQALERQLIDAGVRIRTGTPVRRVSRDGSGCLVELDAESIAAGQVFNCTYSSINAVLAAS